MMRWILLFTLFFHACSKYPSAPERVQNAAIIAKDASLQSMEVSTSQFTFQVYYRVKDTTKPLRIYVEGDGLAWITKSTPSDDPTPVNPVALKLASLDNYENVVYLARPCQYIADKCDIKYWTSHRFSKEVISNFNEVVELLKRYSSTNTLELVGFSGGATVALLASLERKDVKKIITVAGNLDHVAVNRYHKVDLLQSSKNPIEFTEKLADTPQLHLSGSEDKVVPTFITKKYVQKSSSTDVKFRLYSGVSHTKNWEKVWPLPLQ